MNKRFTIEVRACLKIATPSTKSLHKSDFDHNSEEK